MNSLIHLRDVVKEYHTEAGEFTALKNVSLDVTEGEFIAVIGKSGSGKSTLINMITGIDRPSRGLVEIAGQEIGSLSEGEMAEWRGRNLGIVFQFFQLLPTLTIAENVMLPMDFCHMYTPLERISRARELLEMVDIPWEQANKLPSQLSGGQQQRVAIARALANDPKIIAADEPTGNLDSRTAEMIFDLFARLVAEGKTILMVTHDRDLAKRVKRTLVISDGEIIEQYLSTTFPGLTEKQLARVTRSLKTTRYKPGQVILEKGQHVDHLGIVTKGTVEVIIEPAEGRQFIVATLTKGKYFGEIELMQGSSQSIATVRAALHDPVEIVSIDKVTFQKLLNEAQVVKELMSSSAKKHLAEHAARTRKRRK